MTLRKLEKKEHEKTRLLWEEIFKEDTKEFLDYYYSWKMADNEIYVIEEDGQIVSMLHLNPYQIRICDQFYRVHYIVAVATKENYRKRGYMRTLLEHAMEVMTQRGEPFTFLMPAAEAIYKPFGFCYVYEQGQGEMSGKYHEDEETAFAYATEADCGEIAEFANLMLQEYDVVTWRDEAYYQMLLAELQSESGGILLARREGQLVGVFCCAETGEAQGPRLMIREPISKSGEVLEQAIIHLVGNEIEKVSLIGAEIECEGRKKPMIMAKILNPEMINNFENKSVFLNEVV